MSNLVDRAGSSKMPVRKDLAHFRPRVTATLGNVDTRVRIRPAGKGTMLFELFDGFLRMDFDAPETWQTADSWPEPGQVRLTVRRIER